MKKSRKNKLILLGILAIFYIVIAINFHKIRFALSILRLYGQEKKIESPVGENTSKKPIVDNPLEDLLAGVDKSQNSGDTTGDDVDKSVDKVDTVNEPKKEPNVKDDKGTEKIPDTKKSYLNIIGEYNITFENLRATFESELDALIKQGIEEYSNGKISNTRLANKYLSIGADLEKSSDAKFNKILKEMEKELKSNGHDTSVIKEIKNYYTSFKDAKKTNLIDRGMKHMD